MGLRELKATRTRQQIVDTALSLFIDQGYDATTMEQIAERAEVGSTTLYRYFPSKDLLILDRLTQPMNLGAFLRERPAEEPLSVALGAAIHASFDVLDDEDGRLTAVRHIVDNAPIPRARLWDLAAQAQSELKKAIAERMGRPVEDLLVVMTAHVTFAVFHIAGETAGAGDHKASRSESVDELLRTLNTFEWVVPAPPSGPDTVRPRP
ncbi:TetR/AcrR family transcriptional regulator [Streptomyces sp. NPDC102274]|uniref:TetR/AcrR family transcriptional regulator n=1 Tax=Streptomyces sp. NPDC102274 TaxID=3366151 RepID=UPI003827E60D